MHKMKINKIAKDVSYSSPLNNMGVRGTDTPQTAFDSPKT